jgi:uncharacterized membrane protein YedE/YeeE
MPGIQKTGAGMHILIQPQAWLRALEGGVLIGLSAAAMLAFNGRIAGISGVFGGLFFDRTPGDFAWRALFVAGLLAGMLIAMHAGWVAPVTISANAWQVVVAGLLVGFGTRLGNGCTSGHGVCGIARFSPRSVVATAVFMGFGFLTVFVIRHGVRP